MKTELLLGAEEFWTRLSADIGGAKERLYLQTMSLEGDSVGRRLGEAILGSPARERRLLIDSFSKVALSDQFVWKPSTLWNEPLKAELRSTRSLYRALEREGVGIRFTNPMGPLFWRLAARNHKKIIVVDDRVSYLGGFNFAEHNFSWHDMMLRFESEELAMVLAGDFLSTWRGENQSLSRVVDGLEIFLTDAGASHAIYDHLFHRMEQAKREIIVHSPYVSAPFMGVLQGVARRGVRVVLLTPTEHNALLFKHYHTHEALNSPLELRWLPGGMSHLKAMLIDGSVLLTGSSNFDFVSYHAEQEVIVAITDPALVATFRERVLQPDLDRSVPLDETQPRWTGVIAKYRLWAIEQYCRVIGI